MPRDWHETFGVWAKAPSDKEEEKGANAAAMVREAIRSHEVLSNKSIDVYPTGSYRNNTNTRGESDIDIAVVLRDAFGFEFPDSPPEVRAHVAAIPNAAYHLPQFRIHVFDALVSKFGLGSLRVGNKAIDIRATSYRLDADVTPFVEHRRYTGRRNSDGTWQHLDGTEMSPRNAPDRRIVNWHEHHYANGVTKNDRTNRRFKRIVRILKRLRDEAIDQPAPGPRATAGRTPSFLIECLAYNAPDSCFNRDSGTYYGDVKATIADLWHRTKPEVSASTLVEVSGLKPLFGTNQTWTQADAHAFLLMAWNHVGFPS